MKLYLNGLVKFIIGFLTVFAIRLIPFRAPNVEPVLATLMPFSKRYGPVGSFAFGFLSIAFFDVAVGRAGQWTLVTGVAYGLLGVGAYFFFKSRVAGARNFLLYGVLGTILYDAATGLSIRPLFFGQPFREAFAGQIPFTLWHLAGTVGFSLVLSPALYRWVIENRGLEIPRFLDRIGSRIRPMSVDEGV